MSTTITCNKCGSLIEIQAALEGQVEERVLKATQERHLKELEKVKTQATQEAQLAAVAAQEFTIKQLQGEAATERQSNKELRDKLGELMTSLREEKKARENAEIEAQKKVLEEEQKIREDAGRLAEEKFRLKLAEQEKKLADTQRALDDAQRKASQGSQQLQGEILELDFESMLAQAFKDDLIEPVAKGVRGGDIKHIVRSPRGTVCGVMLWEIKRTKNWVDGWVTKLKDDARNEKAHIALIVSDVLPKQVSDDICSVQGIWVCKPALAVILATLLRKSLLDVALQKAVIENRGTKAEALYSFVTSHEFVQAIEAMVETYQDMSAQINKEKATFQKLWAQREAQAQTLLTTTASLIGGMQGHIGQTAMPKIRGLDLLSEG